MKTIIEELIRSQVGKTAKFWEHDREVRNPLNFIIDEAEKQSSKKFVLFWLEEGTPEHFSLSGGSYSPVVFSRRFLEISGFLRSLARDYWSNDIRVELSERLCLKLMSELSLSYGNLEFSVLAFLKSVLGQSVYVDTNNTLMDLELSPINEVYMVNWFYGLVHEMGHIYSKKLSNLLSDKRLIEEFEQGLKQFSNYPEEFKRKAREKIYSSGSVLSLNQLRLEVISDIFGTGVLLQSTINIMKELKTPFRFEAFIAEIIIFMNILILFQRCKETARIASDGNLNRDVVEEILLFAPLSFQVRSQMVIWYLENAFYPSGFDPNDIEQRNKANSQNGSLINTIFLQLRANLSDIDTGLAKAMRFALFPNEREPDLLLKFSKEVSEPNSFFTTRDAKKFCQQAESHGLISEKIQKLRVMVGLNEINLVYTVPWIKGPHGINRPFGLDIKYGHIVFIFHSQSDLYNTFFNISSKNLSAGFTLETALLVFHSIEEMVSELAKTMSLNKRFGLVFEGTQEFRILMEEIARDKI